MEGTILYTILIIIYSLLFYSLYIYGYFGNISLSDDSIISIFAGIKGESHGEEYFFYSMVAGEPYIVYSINVPKYIFFSEKRFFIVGLGVVPRRLNKIAEKIIESKKSNKV